MSSQPRGEGPAPAIGDEFDMDILRVAHGGHMIGHHDGRTVFVRHALPGERVTARVTDVNRRIVRADAVDVLRASSDRVEAPCPWSGPAGCGGCDFQHVQLSAQRAMKSQVLADSLRRFAGLDERQLAGLDVSVRELPGYPDGLHWRSRITWTHGPEGSVGLRAHRRHTVIPVDQCLLGQKGCDKPSTSTSAVRTEVVRGRTWQVAGDAFWQVHPELPETLVATVMEFAAAREGQQWWDLFAGAGLFAASLADQVGSAGRVTAVEDSRAAVASGRAALADLGQVVFVESDVERWLASGDVDAPDGVVLDPPRSGAGRELTTELCEAEIPTLVYVACDPVALARDVGTARAMGYQIAQLRAFDAFPMTHHFETVALITRA